MSDIASAVAGTFADLGGVIDEAEPHEDPNSPAPAAAPQAHETALAPDNILLNYAFDPKLPDDLDELLSLPDDPTPAQVAAYADEDHDELARRLVATERQLEWERSQRITQGQKSWATEAAKYFPLSSPDTITADSRRGYLRAAKEQHQRNYALLKPKIDELEATLAAAKVTALGEAREAAAGAYGRPTLSVGAPPPATTADDRLAAARGKRDLRGSVRALIDGGAV